MASRFYFVIFFFILGLKITLGLPEQGVWTKLLNQNDGYFAISKSMYNNSKVSVNIECQSDTEVTVKIGWVLRVTQCGEEYIGGQTKERAMIYYARPEIDQFSYGYKKVKFQKSAEVEYQCKKDKAIMLKDESGKSYDERPSVPIKEQANNRTMSKSSNMTEASPNASKKPETTKKTEESKKKTPAPKEDKNKKKPGARKKRAADPAKDPAKKVETKTPEKKPAEKTVKKTTKPAPPPPAKAKAKTHLEPGKKHDTADVASTWEDGVYMFIIQMQQPQGKEFNAKVTVWMKADYGYLSAMEWPLLPFFGVMCVIYVIYGFVWLVLSACNWRDLLRIQFWIGGVIILGMLEKAVFYAEYQTINNTGKSVRGAVVFAEIVSCGKRTLARMLVVIVSLGFGIVKPRLGPMLHRVIGMGALYFILGSVEACLRVLRPKSDPSNQALLASIPLAVLDSAICWWVFTSLVQTTRTLRLRRNVVKLSLYRHFTNTLIFAILASVAFMIWSIKEHKFANCLTDWKEIWVDDAYWHMLFSVILLVIMILWRPTNNNQRYAFSPLLDAADEEDEEPMLNDAFDGMKMRGMKNQANGSPKPREGKPRDAKAKVEDDLKWIEDNIPSSVADTALPSLLDSDEEIMTTKFEMSKME